MLPHVPCCIAVSEKWIVFLLEMGWVVLMRVTPKSNWLTLRNENTANERRGITIVTVRDLTAHNWQKRKRVFLTCPYHKIYRDEAVGLKSCKYTWKITIFVKSEIWDNIVKIWYFVNNCLSEARISKFFCTCVTHIIVIIWSTAHFVLT